jgi:hypothetical protein
MTDAACGMGMTTRSDSRAKVLPYRPVSSHPICDALLSTPVELEPTLADFKNGRQPSNGWQYGCLRLGISPVRQQFRRCSMARALARS